MPAIFQSDRGSRQTQQKEEHINHGMTVKSFIPMPKVRRICYFCLSCNVLPPTIELKINCISVTVQSTQAI